MITWSGAVLSLRPFHPAPDLWDSPVPAFADGIAMVLIHELCQLSARVCCGVCGDDVVRRVSLVYFPAELSRAAGNTEEDRTLDRNI